MSEQGCRVLYVDDDEGLRRLVSRALGRRGYEVVCASNGEEGLRLAAEQGFDVITLDHYMPGMDGFETMKALLAQPDPPPIVYVTGSDESRVSPPSRPGRRLVVKVIGDGFFDRWTAPRRRPGRFSCAAGLRGRGGAARQQPAAQSLLRE